MRHLAVLLLGMLAILAVSFTYASAFAVTVEVSIENLSPEHGQGIAPVSFAFHDGSFDLFDEGQPASIAVELMAEDGLNGDPKRRVPLGFFLAAFAAGADPTKAPSVEDTIAGQFALSAAGLVGGVQDLLFFDRRENPYFGVQLPGETLSVNVELDDNGNNQQFFSYAGMLFPTNDAFVGNDDGTAIRVFDDQGMFIGADFVIFGSQVWDAGTEVNDEDPENVPYSLANGLHSVEENGAIHLHEGLLLPGSGGIVDFEFAGELIAVNADFSAPGYEIARITIRKSGDCNEDSVLNAADLSCVSSVEARDAVLEALNTLPGDVDGNGDVAFADFLVLSANFGQVFPSYTDGNIDLKDAIDFADFLVLSANFGKSATATAAVPEPKAAMLLLVGLVSLIRRRSIVSEKVWLR